MKKIYLIISFSTLIYPLKVDRVILSTDANPNYIEFWPIVAKAWKTHIGVQPTLALIAHESVKVDQTLGDVIRFEPIEGISTALHAQVIRLLLPALFENEFCIISDIDMLPLDKTYFLESVQDLPKDCFVVYRDKGYGENIDRYPMCYNGALGKIFKEIFYINSKDDFSKIIKYWASLGLGWHTDELVLYYYLNVWNTVTQKCIKLGHTTQKRIDRSNDLLFDPHLLLSNYYIDAHLLRPYSKYVQEINIIAQQIGVFNDGPSYQI